MAGSAQPVEKLNHTLIYFVNLLNELEVEDWFISYGTLLGMVRDNSCIDGDDDIDICVHEKHFSIIKKKLDDLKFKPHPIAPQNTNGILKTLDTEELCSIDFYFCSVNEEGDYHDKWERVTWSKCTDEQGEIPSVLFENTKINIPHGSVTKLENRYGPTWTTRVQRGTPAGDGYRNRPVI